MTVKENGDGIVTYRYNNNGQVETVRTKDGTTSYQYDAVGGILQRSNPDGSMVIYSYDLAMNPTSVKAVTPNGIAYETRYEYDLMDRITRVISHDGTAVVYEYDANGNRSAVRHANGMVVSYEYDTLNRLVKQVVTGTSEGSIAYEYVLSPSGQRVEVKEPGKTTTYTYDALDRLVKEEITITEQAIRDSVLNEIRETFGSDANIVIEYEYDAVGNRLQKRENGSRTTYTYDANDRMLTAGNVSYTYDANGNLIRQEEPGKRMQYEYDLDNRLVKARMEEGAGLIIETYAYDDIGRRIRKTVSEVSETHYLVDDAANSRVLLEMDASGNVTADYIHGLELLMMSQDGQTYTYLYDGQSNVRKLADENGSVTDTYGFDAFGNLIHKTGITENPFLYRGEYLDANTGFYQLRARYMDPQAGRFISTDPHAGSIYDPVSLHKYLYANANPVMNSDPSGLKTLSELVESVNINAILNMKAQLSMKFIFQAYLKVTNWIIIGRGVLDFLANPTWEGFVTAGGHVVAGLAAGWVCKVAPWVTVPASIAGAGMSAYAAHQAYQEGNIFDAIMYGGRAVAMGGLTFYRCFTEGTLVATVMGLRPIEEIKEGDYVLSYNKETGETEYNLVTQVYVREASKLYLIEAGDEVIETTAGHPFFVEGKGYVEASELQAGYPLLLSNGETLPIGNIQTIYLNEPVLVYNMEIEGNHNYFVGEEEILVHNANYGKKPKEKPFNRTEALNAAKDRAGVPRSQQPVRQWQVGGDITKKGGSYANYQYSSNTGSHGRYYEYSTPKGKVVIVEHTNHVAQGLHTHAGVPKEGYNQFTIDFKVPDIRYKALEVNGDTHIRYQ